jgi:hypothetical protein
MALETEPLISQFLALVLPDNPRKMDNIGAPENRWYG